jgi:di/tricarboxylate transporter
MSNTAVVATFLPVIGSLKAKTVSDSHKKTLVMVTGVAAVLGGHLTLIGSTPQLVVQGILKNAELPPFDFFTLLKGALPLFILGIAYLAIFGTRLIEAGGGARLVEAGGLQRPATVQQGVSSSSAVQQSAPLLPNEKQAESERPKASILRLRLSPTARMCLTGTVLIACVAGFVTGLWTVGTVAILGALCLIITGCINLRTLVQKVDWSPVVILGGSLGLSTGLEVSGAGRMIASGIIDLCGGEAAQPFLIFAAVVVITALLSCLMSNTAVAAMLAPMGIFLAQDMGFDVMTMVVGIVLASGIDFATPIGTPPMTLTLSAGFRFKDYLRVGGPLCVLLVLAIIIFVPLLYGG